MVLVGLASDCEMLMVGNWIGGAVGGSVVSVIVGAVGGSVESSNEPKGGLQKRSRI